MKELIEKRHRLKRRQNRARKMIRGTRSVPRLSISKSNKSLYCQVIDDVAGITLLGVHSNMVTQGKTVSIVTATELGKLVAQKAQEHSIKRVAFDRRGRKYTGRIAALAEGAREAGLKI